MSGIVLFTSGIEMGMRRVDEGGAILIAFPIFGAVLGIAEAIRSREESRISMGRYSYFAIFVISISILAATLHMKGVSYYLTALPALGLSLLVGYFTSRR
ncbi:MAG: hypothetical protein MUF59_03145 [Candidatus Krumholzibacteria bacterium]|jgi:hypothetical protein|nr:hypothetical protein [Candidatus Krumholzibacteria bacterium]